VKPSPVGKTVEKELMIVGIVLGICGLIGIICGFQIWRRKKLASQLDQYEEI
jgi:hypothetical protein